MLELVMHQFDKKRAYIITSDNTHYMTKDRGESWQEFGAASQASIFREVLTFNAGDPDRIIFNAMDCAGIFCDELTLYTTDGFANDPKFLRADTSGCHWAKSTDIFTTYDKDLDSDRILCVVKGRFSPWRKDYRLLISDSYFKDEFEPELEPGRTVQGVVNMAVVKPYVIVAASAEGTDEMALYVSDDTIRWSRAIFPHDHKLTEEAYTVLEGTNYSIQIDVLNSRPSNPMGVFLSSNSNGTYFTRKMEHTNRNTYGLVDFEKITGVQGVVMLNVVQNWEEVETSNAEKKIKSQISFDDGFTFEPLTYKKKDLHLHSVTDLSNTGRVFSSPAPGMVMGIGNTGSYLKDYSEGNLYVSDDAGLTWREGLDGPHKYEFGDQGSILVAIKDAGMRDDDYTDEVKYSLDHGKEWKNVKLDTKIKPIQLTTTQDSTSLKFLIEAVDDSKPNANGYIISLDFDGLHERQCKDSDMETWPARVDDDGNPTCIMGQKQSYRRRKADADCFLKDEFKDPQYISEPCECTDADFECDYNFVRSEDRKECNLAPGGKPPLPCGACKAFGPEDTFKGTNGWRMIPGNQCKRGSGKQKDEPVDRKCADAGGTPAGSGKLDQVQKVFPGYNFKNKVYLERTGISTGADETVLVRTEDGVFISQDHGKTWDQLFKDEAIVAIYPHPYFNDMVFFLTPSKKVFYSTDRGKNVRSFNAPSEPNVDGFPVMNFHPDNKDWIIWIGARDCPGSECHAVASLTLDRGDGDWKTLQRYVRKCEFIEEPASKYRNLELAQKKIKLPDEKAREKLIFCEARKHESNDINDNPWTLVSSDDFFNEAPNQHFDNVVDFATMSEFIVVATKDDEKSTLKVQASIDGATFASADFPHGFNVDHQQGYTVLDSSTHSVFLHVTVNNEQGFEYGSIIKSNSNGTSYVMALDAVDRDSVGYVDFEKMFGIEGVAMVNVVSNYKDKNFKKDGKKLKTMITHNDGAEWDYLPPPKADEDGKKYGCGSKLDKCSLHIHGYTERSDKSHTYSSASAIGLMVGTGNVGEFLTTKKDADTFMTSDAGVNWKFVKKGMYMWEFGDQGSIVVIVKEREPTKEVFYSLDEGDSWVPYNFAESEVTIDDITTVPSDNSRNFLLWGQDGSGKLITFNLDFSGLTDQQCELDEGNVNAGDYYLWTPKHPKQDDDCLFGHESQYHRKRTDKTCYNGRMIPHLHDIAKNCSCTRRDFECDFNYERQSDGSCALVSGLSPPDPALICTVDEDRIEYDDPTGYRRIPITTCVDGLQMDKSISHACPGKGDQFKKKHGLSAAGIFFAVTIPIAAAAGVGYWVWKNWANKFGQIRLGEQSSFDSEAPYIKYPVLIIAGLVAAIQAAPLLISSLWRSATTAFGRSRPARFTTRDSFARGRGDYAVVDDDEGELLGEESDEEV
ncbi:Oligoxyloglucan reducing end-specific cellobiohydrolase [Mollisia scopiformis]|uniref:Vacuolar protein sorting/targeting protein 10 n=1 Tax=Mollisia scopiformis TaxID=149040 RepID=A0A132B9H4_MOLSC|nr:Oligoxyloglucan reducing end-specific cellobiohydrolase [Mollisia scopiformis]KUJ08524.1 Oligoxyloglucan reducing end-specific cellobiohydrolase [Mollisia scopiformis]